MQPMWPVSIVVAILALPTSSWVLAQAGRTTADRVYSDAQAAAGQATYDAKCNVCHGATLGGALAPPLSGATFLGQWGKRPLVELVDKIEHTMPASDPGTLSRAQATELVAYVLKSNGFLAGAAALEGAEALTQIVIVDPASASDPGRPAAVLQLPSGPPPGNLAQVMRGILFPSSNLLFNVQNTDPGEVKMGWQPGGPADFSWVGWGAGIYSGWELVDYAAIALAESRSLLLTPARRCENGRLVPVDREDWMAYTEELVEAGRAAYRASQSRNRDAVIEVTNQIADACLRCHEVYRDKPGGTAADPSNKAARCVP